jgi:hypothetical protein
MAAAPWGSKGGFYMHLHRGTAIFAKLSMLRIAQYGLRKISWTRKAPDHCIAASLF